MIADDMMTFIKSDIVVFGIGVLLFIIATLWFVFRKLIWIIVPISSCVVSVIIVTGLLGLLGWKVTVISSNFIALMLILTMAMNIHLSTRFLQLKIITIPVTEKIKFFLLIESDPRKVVNLEFCSFLSEIFSEGAKFKNVGNKVKVIINEVIRPKVIIHPKSIIGLISLKIKDKNAKIVVNTVYKIGQNIFLVVKEMICKVFLECKFFLNCKNLVLV